MLWGVDLLGWGVKTSVWLQPHNVLAPVSKAYAALPGILSLVATYVFLLAVTALGAAALLVLAPALQAADSTSEKESAPNCSWSSCNGHHAALGSHQQRCDSFVR